MLSTAVDEYKHVTIKDLKIRLEKNDKDIQPPMYKDLNMCTSDQVDHPPIVTVVVPV